LLPYSRALPLDPPKTFISFFIKAFAENANYNYLKGQKNYPTSKALSFLLKVFEGVRGKLLRESSPCKSFL